MKTILIIAIVICLIVSIVLILRMKQFRTILNQLLNELNEGKNRSFQIETMSDKISSTVFLAVFFTFLSFFFISLYRLYF